MVQKIALVCSVALFVSTGVFAQDDAEPPPQDAVSVAENASASNAPKTPSKLALHGNPREVTEYKGTAFDALVRVKTTVYKNGRVSAETLFDAAGNASSSVSYVYTPTDLLSEIHGAGADGNVKWAYRYEYDDSNRLIKETSVIFQNSQEVLEGYVDLAYGETGLLSLRETFSADGTVTLRENFSYNENGKRAEETSYYGDETLLKRTVYEYASAQAAAENKFPEGALTKIRRYDANGLYETTAYEYRSDGAVSRVLRYGADGVLKDSETRMYSEGKLVRRVTVNAEGATAARNFCLYDWMGNPVFERTFEGITVREFFYPETE